MSGTENPSSTDDTAVPFAYINAVDSQNRRIWAVIAAPPSKQEAIRAAVNGAKTRGDHVNLPSLITAFKGEITASGQGDVPKDVREALQLLYGENEQGALDFGT